MGSDKIKKRKEKQGRKSKERKKEKKCSLERDVICSLIHDVLKMKRLSHAVHVNATQNGRTIAVHNIIIIFLK